MKLDMEMEEKKVRQTDVWEKELKDNMHVVLRGRQSPAPMIVGSEIIRMDP